MGWTSANILGQIFEHVISILFRLGIPSKVTLCFLVLIHQNHQIRFAEDFLNRTSNTTRKNTDTDTRLFFGVYRLSIPFSQKTYAAMSVKTPDWERFDFFLIRDISCDFLMKQMCLDAWHVRVHEFVMWRPWGFPGGFDDLNGQKKREEVYRSRCFGPMGEPLFKRQRLIRWTSLHSTTGVAVMLKFWWISDISLSKPCVLSDIFCLVKCVKIPLGRFVWFYLDEFEY